MAKKTDTNFHTQRMLLELFEGAAVIDIVGGIQSEGRIVAFLGNQIVISLRIDFRPRIDAYIVRIDNTAMRELFAIGWKRLRKKR